MNSAGTRVLSASLDVQNGTQDPIEFISSLSTNDLRNWLLVIKATSAAGRYLHLNTHRGKLGVATDGQMYDHAAAANAVGVAATDATRARGAGGVFNGTESVETFSSDGPRRIFYRPDGRAITPGNFSSSGGLLLQKPDVTAADGVLTATPEFEDFHGTSAAAPHAAAIAALMLQAAGGPRSLTRAQLLRAMQDTALDIEAPGAWDRDSGAGIIDALAAVANVGTIPNRPPVPVGSLPDLTLRMRDGAVTVNVASAFRDPDGDLLTYGATSSNVAVARVNLSGSTMTVTPVAAGTATITVTATDVGGSNTPAQQAFTVTVANQVPLAVGALPPLSLRVIDGPVAVDVSQAFRDPDGDPLTYGAASSAPSVATVSVSGSAVRVTPVSRGSTTITVTAIDIGGSNMSARQVFTVTVQSNRSPMPLGTLRRCRPDVAGD